MGVYIKQVSIEWGFTVLGLVKMVSYLKVLAYGFLYQIHKTKRLGFVGKRISYLLGYA